MEEFKQMIDSEMKHVVAKYRAAQEVPNKYNLSDQEIDSYFNLENDEW